MLSDGCKCPPFDCYICFIMFWRVPKYLPVMICTDTYLTTFMFTMMLWYDIVYTTILHALPSLHGIPTAWVYASWSPGQWVCMRACGANVCICKSWVEKYCTSNSTRIGIWDQGHEMMFYDNHDFMCLHYPLVVVGLIHEYFLKYSRHALLLFFR